MTTRHVDGAAPETPATDVLLSEWNLRDVLEHARERLDADVATVLRLDPASRHLVAVLTLTDSRASLGHHRVPLGRGLAGRVAESGTMMFLDDVKSDELANPALLALGVRSVVAIPLWNGSALIGVLKVASRQPHHFGHERRTLSLALAERVTTAIEAYFAADERGAAAALQRSLVPATLPALDGLELAGRYVPGEGGVSGDWYDVFSLPGGRVGLVMGDVAGHGLPASVVMGRLRSALRAYSLEYDDPATVLSHLDAKIVHFEPDAMATVVYAVTRPPFDEIQISSAGHLPPIVLATDGSTYEAEIPISLPLGVDTAQRRTSGTVRMAAGSSLILYTDGLIERRAKSTTRSREVFDSISSAQEELCRNLSTGPADDIASGILDSMLTIEPPIDDVALLVVRRTGWSID